MIDNHTDCLLSIDVQNDFCPGGALAVPDGDQVVAVINNLGRLFRHRILTQDWHPGEHQCFASNQSGGVPYTTIELDYGPQVLWPDHCVQGTPGAAFHPLLDTGGSELILRKGFRPAIDSYSAFFENDQTTATGLDGYLRARGFERVFLCGLATDFCVGFSALDARKSGFDVYLIDNACRGIDLEGSLTAIRGQMQDAGVNTLTSADLDG